MRSGVGAAWPRTLFVFLRLDFERVFPEALVAGTFVDVLAVVVDFFAVVVLCEAVPDFLRVAVLLGTVVLL